MSLINVLAVGAHPDDVELGCGGTLIKHLDLNHKVHVIIMTNGENGNHSPDREECLNSLKTLGIKKSNTVFGNFQDGYLPHNADTVGFIENYINRFNINRIYTHFYDDWHQDHRNCSYAASAAARNIVEILLFKSYSTNPGFEPHFFIELSEEQLNKKLYSLKQYESQIKKGCIDLKQVKNQALVGSKRDIKYLESFVINHMIKRGKDV